MEEKSKIKKCVFCLLEATCLCYKCLEYYCDSCYNIAHKSEERKNHKKEKIDYYVPMDMKCPEHNLIPISLFCVDEKGNKIKFLNFDYRALLCLLSL